MPSRNPRFPPSTLPVADMDTIVELPSNRSPNLPTLYRAVNHPLHRGVGIAYYYIQDGSMDGMKRAYHYEDGVQAFPQESEADALDKGYFRLLPGDAVFQRLMTSSSSGIDDVIVCLVLGRDELSPDLVQRSEAMREVVLGPEGLRSREKPSRSQDATGLHGGTHFERVFPEGQTVQSGRCYGHGTSFERQTRIFAPSAQGKLTVADQNTLDMRRELIMVGTQIAMQAIHTCPPEVEENLRLNSEMYNMPSIGADNNVAFTSYQLNFAPVRLRDSTETLGDAMGEFGDAHIDENDAPGHFTAVTVFSEIPERFDPGRFFLAYPGVFCQLDFLATVVFSGTRRHGSSPPIASGDASDDELRSAVRFISVCYGGAGPTQQFQKRPIGVAGVDTRAGKGKFAPSSSRSKGKKLKKALLFDVTPEMMDPTLDISNIPQATRSTFIKEGPSIMSPRSFVTFICRSLLMFVVFMLAQMPADIGTQVDSDAFLASFSYLDHEGRRKTLGPWSTGPGWRAQSLDGGDAAQEVAGALNVGQKDYIAQRLLQWKAYYNKYAGHIPFAVAYLKDVHPLEGGSRVPPKFKTVHPALPDPPNNDNPDQPAAGPSGANEAAVNNALAPGRARDEWLGVDRSLMERALMDARSQGPDFTIQLDASDDDGDASPMDISDDDEATEADIPSYLKCITRQTVHDELLEVQNSLIALENKGAFLDRVTVSRLLQGFHRSIFLQPLDAGSFGHIQAGWTGLRSMISTESESVFLNRMRRGSIMRINFSAWNWLETCIPQAVSSIYSGTDDPSCLWLAQMVNSIRSALREGSSELNLLPSDYGVQLEDPIRATLDLSNFLPDAADDVQVVVSNVQDVLATWLRFPTNTPAVYQARFVGSVIRLIGYEALVLDCVWRKCQKATKHFFRSCPPLPPLTVANSREFEVLDVDSGLRKDIREIFGIIMEVFDTHNTHTRFRIGYKSARLQGTLETRINIFKKYVRDCYAYALDNIEIENTDLRAKLRHEPDSFLPFRELAPSRRRYTASDGPFSSAVVRTLEALLSGIAYRAILFNSEYSRDSHARAFFTSPDDFRRAIANRPIDSVCNMSAYGKHSNSKRSPELIDHYWDTLKSVDCSIFTSSERIPFRACFHFFKPTRGTRFQELGPLGAYMLTADYVYAGIVEWPTHDEMGKMIQFLNKSPVDAFELLGLIPPRSQGQGKTMLKAAEADCIQAFSKAHNMVMDALSPVQAERAGLDVIVTEHVLCKFYRSKSFLGL